MGKRCKQRSRGRFRQCSEDGSWWDGAGAWVFLERDHKGLIALRGDGRREGYVVSHYEV